MKKRVVLSLIFACLVVITSFIFASCGDSQAGELALKYNKKYYRVDTYQLEKENESENWYYIFYKDGTGEYKNSNSTLSFKYFLTESTVHCFAYSNNNSADEDIWDEWYYVSENVIYRNTVQFVCEDYLNEFLDS